MEIELRDIDSIRPYDQNPRLNDSAVAVVAESLKEFGFRQPIVVDREGLIVVGHTRWKAAKKLGLLRVPVHVAKDLTEAQIRGYRLADNKTAEIADWDYELLPVELRELQNMDFNLDLLGFSEEELSDLLAEPAEEGLTDEDAVPEPPKEAVTKPGDLYILGGKVKCPKCGKEHCL